jgi:hypothetical protein
MLTSPARRRSSASCAILLVALSLAASAEEAVVKILAPWEAEGKLYRVGPQQIQFLGAFEGIMYLETGDSELDAALFICPTRHELDEATERTSASGRCHIVAAEGNVYGRFECEGKIGSCDGRFEITAGTDALAGITGGGPMQIRTALTATMRNAVSGDMVTEAAGLAVWPELRIDIPRSAE